MKRINHAEFEVFTDRPPLAPPFEKISQLIAICGAESMKLVAEFACALLNSESFNVMALQTLPEDHQHLCTEIFEYCLSTGLSEEERHAAFDVLKPYADGLTCTYLH